MDGDAIVDEGAFVCEIFDLRVSEEEEGTGIARVLCNLGDVDERVIDDLLFVARTNSEIEVSSRNEVIVGDTASLGLSGIYGRCQ